MIGWICTLVHSNAEIYHVDKDVYKRLHQHPNIYDSSLKRMGFKDIKIWYYQKRTFTNYMSPIPRYLSLIFNSRTFLAQFGLVSKKKL